MSNRVAHVVVLAGVSASVLTGAAASVAGRAAPSPAVIFRLGAPPVAVAVEGRSVWVVVETKRDEAQLWQLDSRTGTRLRSVRIGPAGPDIGAVAATSTGVWAAAGAHVVGILRGQPDRVLRVGVRGTASSLASGVGSVWVAVIGAQQNLVLRLDPSTLRTRARIRTPGGAAVAVDLGSVWAAGSGSLGRIDPSSDRLTVPLSTTSGAVDLASSRQALWMLQGGVASALDRDGKVRRQIALPFGAARIAVSGGRLWAIDNCGCAIGQLVAMDIPTGRRIADWAVGATPVAVAADRNRVWVANFGNLTLASIRAG